MKVGSKFDIMAKLEQYFIVYDIEFSQDVIKFYVIPKGYIDKEFKNFLISLSKDYDVEFKREYGELVLELKKTKNNIWVNILLLIATFCSTTLMGSMLAGNIIDGFLFSLAIMFVLGSHEMGHYFAARKWTMRTSLPYFIPFPTIIGTLGAIIKHRGPIPNRKALFDVGVSGPLVGIVASIIVTLIGLNLPFEVKKGEIMIALGVPPLFELLAKLVNYDKQFIHPVAFAGWVGLFVTFLNLIPVGQLDGGHVLRAMIGKRAEIVSRFMPIVLVMVGLVIGGTILIFWGFITFFFSLLPQPEPLDDITPIDWKRKIIGLLTFCLALMCFTPVPFTIVSNDFIMK